MNAGLPGTGIGGLFYIAGALWMPVDAIYHRLRHPEHGPRWRSIVVQVGIALGILVALSATGWIVGDLAAPDSVTERAVAPGVGAEIVSTPAEQVASAVRWATALGSVGVLVLVLALVQVLRLVFAVSTRGAALPRRSTAGADEDYARGTRKAPAPGVKVN